MHGGSSYSQPRGAFDASSSVHSPSKVAVLVPIAAPPLGCGTFHEVVMDIVPRQPLQPAGSASALIESLNVPPTLLLLTMRTILRTSSAFTQMSRFARSLQSSTLISD